MQTTDDVVAKAARGEFTRKPRSKARKRLCTAAGLVLITGFAVLLVWVFQPSKPPSALCVNLHSQVVALQDQAQLIQGQPAPDWAVFNTDVAEANQILTLMRQKNCPNA